MFSNTVQLTLISHGNTQVVISKPILANNKENMMSSLKRKSKIY